MEKINRKQFTFYESFYLAIKEIKNEKQQAKIFRAIAEYSLYGKTPELSGVLKMAWELIKPNLDASIKKSIAGKKGGQAKIKQNESKIKANDKQEQNESKIETMENLKQEQDRDREQEKEQEKEQDRDREQVLYKEKEKKEIFKRPTIEEVKNYCLERKNQIDPESFVAFYNSKGWKVGNQPMKDWKAAVITWERKSKAITPVVNTDKKDEFYL